MEILIRTVYPDWNFVDSDDVSEILEDVLKDDTAFEYITVSGFNYDRNAELLTFDRHYASGDSDQSIYVFVTPEMFSDFLKRFIEVPHELFVFDKDIGLYGDIFDYDDFVELRNKVYKIST